MTSLPDNLGSLDQWYLVNLAQNKLLKKTQEKYKSKKVLRKAISLGKAYEK